MTLFEIVVIELKEGWKQNVIAESIAATHIIQRSEKQFLVLVVEKES